VYHQINPLNCPPLEKLNRLARHTVAFGLEQTLTLSDNVIKTRFIQYLAVHNFPEAGQWLWGKHVVIRPHLLKLVKRSLAEKQGILTVIDADLDLAACFTGGCFHASTIPAGSRAALNGEVKAIFLAFYEFLNEKGGVPGDKIGEHTNLTRQTVLRAYLTAQRGHLSVCPGCDGSPPSVADGEIHTDLDHFFPKAKYPFLTIHPLNLTPFCKDCNQSYKHQKDALYDTESLVSTITSLNEIYHPYIRPARDEIEVGVERDAARQEKFKLRPRQDTPIHKARLNSLLYTLNIEARWTGDLQEERVQDYLENCLLHGTQDEPTLTFDLAWLTEQLPVAQASFHRGRGKIKGYVAAEAYTTFVLSDASAQAQLLARMQQARP
jgi:hypothetical protein